MAFGIVPLVFPFLCSYFCNLIHELYNLSEYTEIVELI